MRTILIVDDHESVLQTLSYVLGLRGYQTRSATTGPAGIELARSEIINAALVDLHMPGMDGFALCRALREQAVSRGSEFPVWIMTAAPVPAALPKAIEAGAVSVLRKPFDFEELLRSLDEYCGGAKVVPDLPPRTSAPQLSAFGTTPTPNPAPAR